MRRSDGISSDPITSSWTGDSINNFIKPMTGGRTQLASVLALPGCDDVQIAVSTNHDQGAE
jgi:hypothetical protein